MIDKTEVLKMATDLGLRPDTVEKDYVLGWMLWGINTHPLISNWAFKGGTSLKKCHFETYRFSEDLDFTLVNKNQLTIDFLSNTFIEITNHLYDEVGIEFFSDQFKFKINTKEQGHLSAVGKIHFNGPLRRTQGVASIKLDLTTDEVLVLDTVPLKVHHPYSDEPGSGIQAICYAFEEIVAEKTRALAQRARPRDLYDVIHFYRNRHLIEEPSAIYEVLKEKCAFKSIPVPTFITIEQHEKIDELEPQWKHMLDHQLPSLPPMDSFWRELPYFFDWLISGKTVSQTEPYKLGSGERIVRHGRMRNAYELNPIIESIQYAAANRLCVNIIYLGKSRTVEPLSFRQSKVGKQFFLGHERDDNKVKMYELTKIEAVSATKLPYTPTYPIEINANGPINMPRFGRS